MKVSTEQAQAVGFLVHVNVCIEGCQFKLLWIQVLSP